MNPDVRRRWVEALRSGGYAQGHSKLARVADDGVTRYCCLGVLCDLAAREGVCDVTYHDGTYQYDGYPSFLPPAVVEWAGLEEPNPIVRGISLGVRNDNVRDSFGHIADLIEAHL